MNKSTLRSNLKLSIDNIFFHTLEIKPEEDVPMLIDDILDVLIEAMPENRIFVSSLQGSAMAAGYKVATDDITAILTEAKKS